jgi:hypothetical protein
MCPRPTTPTHKHGYNASDAANARWPDNASRQNGDTHKNARFTKDTADKTGMSGVVSGLVLHSVVISAAAAWQIAIVVVPDIIVHRPMMRPRRVYRAVRHRFGPSLGGIRADSSERENHKSAGEKLQHVEILLASPLQTNFSSYRRDPP